MEKLSEEHLSNIRVETLKNEITRFKKRIERNEKEIERLTKQHEKTIYTPNTTDTIFIGDCVGVRYFDSEGRRLKV